MINRDDNLAALHLIATAIGELNDEAVYVGGAVIGLYAEPNSDDTRPTKDVDFFLEITTPVQLEKVRETLTHRGFKQTHEDEVLCRFRYSDIKVDVMSTQAIGWAPANIWFQEGMAHTITVAVAPTKQIRILELPYFLATKFAAFNDRGTDPRTSHDMEDLIYVLDSNSTWETAIANTTTTIKDYLHKQFAQIEFETILAHLAENDRAKLVMERIREMLRTWQSQGNI